MAKTEKEWTAESIAKALETDGVCNINGVVKLVAERREARPGRNPKTGENITIAAKTVVKAKISSTILARLNNKA